MVYPQSSWMNIRHTHIQSDVAKCVLQTVCGSGRISKLPMHTRLQRNNCTISFVFQLTNSRIQSRKDAVIYCICVDLIGTKKSVNENDENMKYTPHLMHLRRHHLHSLCHQLMIVLLISLNIMIKTFPACYHCQRSTCLSQYDEEDSNMKHSCTVVLWKEEYSDCKFNP
mmetsp:Transcript_26728/g.40400  ORF Transcript_26728/g.40400 Transcript_26728/m.40400 type:complete len:169 (-) Transcript_26728:523-1029(-)